MYFENPFLAEKIHVKYFLKWTEKRQIICPRLVLLLISSMAYTVILLRPYEEQPLEFFLILLTVLMFNQFHNFKSDLFMYEIKIL